MHTEPIAAEKDTQEFTIIWRQTFVELGALATMSYDNVWEELGKLGVKSVDGQVMNEAFRAMFEKRFGFPPARRLDPRLSVIFDEQVKHLWRIVLSQGG